VSVATGTPAPSTNAPQEGSQAPPRASQKGTLAPHDNNRTLQQPELQPKLQLEINQPTNRWKAADTIIKGVGLIVTIASLLITAHYLGLDRMAKELSKEIERKTSEIAKLTTTVAALKEEEQRSERTIATLDAQRKAYQAELARKQFRTNLDLVIEGAAATPLVPIPS
jgi:hypothetical protein